MSSLWFCEQRWPVYSHDCSHNRWLLTRSVAAHTTGPPLRTRKRKACSRPHRCETSHRFGALGGPPEKAKSKRAKGGERVSKVKRVLAVLSLAVTLLMALGAPAYADGPCAPGQHGNQQPGFKPPSCPHN